MLHPLSHKIVPFFSGSYFTALFSETFMASASLIEVQSYGLIRRHRSAPYRYERGTRLRIARCREWKLHVMTTVTRRSGSTVRKNRPAARAVSSSLTTTGDTLTFIPSALKRATTAASNRPSGFAAFLRSFENTIESDHRCDFHFRLPIQIYSIRLNHHFVLPINGHDLSYCINIRCQQIFIAKFFYNML